MPFTRTLAQQELRMTKVRMKILECFRSEQAALVFATLRSVLSIARKQSRNAIKALLPPPDELQASVMF